MKNGSRATGLCALASSFRAATGRTVAWTTERPPAPRDTAGGLAETDKGGPDVDDDSDVEGSLRAVAEALTIWHELEPQPEVDDD